MGSEDRREGGEGKEGGVLKRGEILLGLGVWARPEKIVMLTEVNDVTWLSPKRWSNQRYINLDFVQLCLNIKN